MSGEWRVFRSARIPDAPYRVEIVWRGQLLRRIYCVRPWEASGHAYGFVTDGDFAGEEGERIEVEPIVRLRESGAYLNFTVDDGRLRLYNLMRVGAALDQKGLPISEYLLRCEVDNKILDEKEGMPADIAIATSVRKREQLTIQGIPFISQTERFSDYQVVRGTEVRASINYMGTQELIDRISQWDSFSHQLRTLGSRPRAMLLVGGEMHDVAAAPSLLRNNTGSRRLAQLMLIDGLKVVFAGSRKQCGQLIQDIATEISHEALSTSEVPKTSEADEVRRLVSQQNGVFMLGDIAQLMPTTNPLNIRRELHNLLAAGELVLAGKTVRSGFRRADTTSGPVSATG